MQKFGPLFFDFSPIFADRFPRSSCLFPVISLFNRLFLFGRLYPSCFLPDRFFSTIFPVARENLYSRVSFSHLPGKFPVASVRHFVEQRMESGRVVLMHRVAKFMENDVFDQFIRK